MRESRPSGYPVRLQNLYEHPNPYSFFELVQPYALLHIRLHYEQHACYFGYAGMDFFHEATFSSRTQAESEAILTGLEQLHRNDSITMLVVTEGYLGYRTESEVRYCNAGEMLILNPQVYHHMILESSFSAYYLMLSDELMLNMERYHNAFNAAEHMNSPGASVLRRLRKLQHKDTSDKVYLELLPLQRNAFAGQRFEDLFSRMMAVSKYPTASTVYFISAHLMNVFTAIGRDDLYEFKEIHLDSDHSERLFELICHYLSIHHGNLSRQELEHYMHYHSDYLNRIIKKHTGHPFTELRRKYAMNYAAELLLQEHYSIDEIMVMTGYLNRTSFYSDFKKTFGSTPKVFRELHHHPGKNTLNFFFIQVKVGKPFF